MQIRNIFCLNDWNIRSFFIIILSLYLIHGSSIVLNILGFSLPFLQQIAGFLLLLFVPGFLFLRILKLHDLGTVETVAYAVGLSLSILMCVGFFINIIYPLFGVAKPLSFPFIQLTLVVVIVILVAASYLRDREYQTFYTDVDILQFITPMSLLIYLVPCISIIGSFLTHRYLNNSLSIVTIILIAILVLSLSYKKQGYPPYIDVMLLLSVSISLLFGDLLISDYPRRLNVDGEYYCLNQVIQNDYWNSSSSGSANTVLSIVMLGSIFSELLGIGPSVILKNMYLLIFMIVPVILYSLYKREFSNKLSFFAVIFFMFNFYFFTEALLLRRQQIALFFVALLLLLLTEKKISPQNRSLLYLIFTISLVVSHYSVSMNWILIVILASLVYFIKIIFDMQIFSYFFRRHDGEEPTKIIEFGYYLPISYICILIAVFVAWYMYIGFSAFSGVVGAGNTIIENLALFADISSKSPTISNALGEGFWDLPAYSKLYRVLQYAAQGLLIIGLISSFYSNNFRKLNFYFRMAAMAFLILAIILPFMSVFQNIPRLHFFILFFLSPCCIYGAYQIYFVFSRLYGGAQVRISKIINWHSTTDESIVCLNILENRSFYVILTIIFLLPFFFFNVGLVFYMGGFNEETRSLAKVPSSNLLSYEMVDTGYHNSGEIVLGSKLSLFLDKDVRVYADTWIGYDIASAWYEKTFLFPYDLEISKESYLFMRSWNINHGKLQIPIDNPYGKTHYVDIKYLLLSNKNYIYSNGYASLYKET